MDCTHWNESLIGRLYDEISAEENVALETHLGTCAACRATLDDMRRVRGVLAADEPVVPRAPRVVVLRAHRSWTRSAMAASLLGAALLGGLGTGAGYALGRQRAPQAPVATTGPEAGRPTAVTLDPATEELIRNEVARRVEAIEAARPAAEAPDAIRAADLKAELARFERKLNAARATELDYMLGEIEASELRTGSRIGKTNDAIRTVALASNGYVPAQ
jgi:Putative zinc-finger